MSIATANVQLLNKFSLSDGQREATFEFSAENRQLKHKGSDMKKTLLLSLVALALTACGPEYSSDAECLVKERQEGFEGSTGALLQFCSEDQRKETLAERLQNRS